MKGTKPSNQLGDKGSKDREREGRGVKEDDRRGKREKSE